MNLSEEHIRQLEALEQREKSNTHRIDEHEEKLNKLDDKVSKLSDVYVALTKVDDKVSNVEKDVSTIKTDLKDLKEKPSKRYEQIVSLIITRYRNSYIGLFFSKIRIIERRK